MSQIEYLLDLVSTLKKYLDANPYDQDFNLCWDLLIAARDDLTKI